MNINNKIKFNRPELVFICIAGFFGILSAILMPILSAPDENQHFQVSYAIFSKNGRAPSDLVLLPQMIISTVRSGSYNNYFSKKTAAKDDGFAINTNNYVFDGKTRASIFDIMRLPQALGILVARNIYPSLGFMVLIGRLFNLAFSITAVYFIIKKVKYGKWSFLFIACTPMIIQQTASLSYDGMNLVAILAWFAFIINTTTQTINITKKQITTGIILLFLLLVTKSNNILLLMLLLAIPTGLIPIPNIVKKIRSSKHWNVIKYISISIILAIACIIIYIMGKKILAGQEFHPKRLISVLLNTFYWGDLQLIDATTIGVIGQFSNFYYHLPVWMVVIAFVSIIIIMLHERIPRIPGKLVLISGLLFIGSILLISVGMYYGWAMRPVRLGLNADIADGIQGRYFTPLLVLLLPVIVYLQKFIKITTSNKNIIPIITICSCLLLLSTYLIQTYHYFWM